MIGVGCSTSAQCTPYYSGVSACINGCCCTVPNSATTVPPGGVGSACWYNQNQCTNGGRMIGVGCSTSAQCTPYYSGVSACINGCCCTVPNSATTVPPGGVGSVACGGLAAIASCTNNQCQQGFSCTPSNYCCECPVGRSSGRCNNGVCPSGFTCQANGYCCASCPGNVTPYGACRNGGCGGGATCRAGNICCL
uniref:Uncharacterized protein n=1 Tax=Panagrolaimus sp. ES5 TaxID=591445 RepID=A0AC34F373_9BILA